MGQLHSTLTDEIKSNRKVYYCSNLEYAGLAKIGLYLQHIPDGYIKSADLVFQITDHLGNVCAETGSSGHEIATYYPSGIRVDNSATYLNSDYAFANKEFQSSHRLNLYDFGKRYYEMHLSHWTTMDPLCEKYYWLSPYSYCGGNPINRIDPDGTDIWEVDELGFITWAEESEEHQVYYVNSLRERSKDYVTIKDRSILDALQVVIDKKIQGTPQSVTKDVENRMDLFKLFKFVSDNTKVEWAIHKQGNNYTLGTKHLEENSGNYSDYGITAQPEAKIHSHPDINEKGELSSMGVMNGNRVNPKGDWVNVINEMQDNGKQLTYSYVYFPKSTNLYHVFPYSPVLIRKINKNPRRFFFGVF